ncbi:MAG: bifunctional [glutamate--ammonia ligase]-adenylyl-L-tyrosine phosphorylase/[glutamate--ammonia-ligase] adenylyltransferase [Halioglobus sp.]
MPLELSALEESLANSAVKAWDNILERAEEPLAAALRSLAERPEASIQLPRALACSPFIAELSRRKPQLLASLLADGSLYSSVTRAELLAQLTAELAIDEAELNVVLRRFRQRHMLRIIWRDFCKLADTLETVRDTSWLAEICISAALDVCQKQLEEKHGVPLGRRSGTPQQLIVLAMGKLGAGELNVSSDIDLIFAYPEAGETDGERKPLSNEEFFTRLGRAVIAALDVTTAEGFVFRVDMRLRPYGESGALVHNFTALEEYYQDQGRDWERYALIKARPLTGDPERARELMTSLRPFIFRRYVDFGVIESLRTMKQGINAEVRRRGLADNVKLGHGGIREVEFIAQCLQLIRGGRDLGLQQRELLPVLSECAELGCLPAVAVAELREAYLFLRDSEHVIQGYADQQSQTLPSTEEHRLAMITVMGFESWESYLAALDAHRDKVSRHFQELIASPDEDNAEPELALGLRIEQLTKEALGELGYSESEALLEQLQAFWASPRVESLQSEGKQRLEQFVPLLLLACADSDSPDLALRRILPLVVAVVRRSAYLALLIENPGALRELVALCAASPWIAEQMARSPVLLDELLDQASLYSTPDKQALEDELRQQVARLPLDDLEAQMDALRYFKAAQVLRVAASETAGRLPVMKVSDKLTFIAEVILEHTLNLAWADLSAKYGEPQRPSEGKGFAVFGYGKLGGIELGYGSDLDLVFICEPAPQGVTNGERSIDNILFYTRLGQRIIHILESRMTLGKLYEVDMRLRPSGNSGMLVSTLQGFAAYQQETAWTWEHQALVRARWVAGDSRVAAGFTQLRNTILTRARDEHELACEVVRMRERMREHLLPKDSLEKGEFHLKQGGGGIVDIEFMVQYAVLAWSSKQPALAGWPDNVRILETLCQEGLFTQAESEILTDGYLAYRSAAHQLALQQLPGVVSAERFADLRQAVQKLWHQLFAAVPEQDDDIETGVVQ